MSDVCKLLEESQFFSCRGGVSEKAIAEAEERLDVIFAEDYRDYLLKFGAADYYGHELTGLGGPKRVDVVDVTFDERKMNPDVPPEFYVIEETHIDGVVFWQNRTGRVYESAPLTEPVKRFESLVQYIKGTM